MTNAVKAELRRSVRVWILLLCGPALVGVLVVAFTRAPEESLSFEIVDYVTGKRIQSPTVEVSRKWTRLPLESIPFLKISPFRQTTIPTGSGLVHIAHVPKIDLSCRMVVGAKGYADAFIQQQPPDECSNPDVYQITYFPSGGSVWLELHDSPYEYVNRKKLFTVALEPLVGGVERDGVRYRTIPSPGSKERALGALNRRAQKRGSSGGEVTSVQFINGHWEVRIPRVMGSQAQYDLGEDGELLGIHPGE